MHERSANGDAYISVDVETDGPIPGPYSMLALEWLMWDFQWKSMELTPVPSKTFYVEFSLSAKI